MKSEILCTYDKTKMAWNSTELIGLPGHKNVIETPSKFDDTRQWQCFSTVTLHAGWLKLAQLNTKLSKQVQ